jgi:hypothetical protein
MRRAGAIDFAKRYTLEQDAHMWLTSALRRFTSIDAHRCSDWIACASRSTQRASSRASDQRLLVDLIYDQLITNAFGDAAAAAAPAGSSCRITGNRSPKLREIAALPESRKVFRSPGWPTAAQAGSPWRKLFNYPAR